MCGGPLSFSDICQDLWVLCRPVLDQEESVEAWVSICELALSFEGRLRLLHHEDVKTSFPCQVEGNILGKLRPGYIELHQAGHFALSHAVSGFVVSHLSLVVHFDVSAFRDCSFVRVLRQVAVIDAQDCARGTVVWTSAEGSDQRCSPMWLLHGPVSPYHRWSVLQSTLAARPADCWQGSFVPPDRQDLQLRVLLYRPVLLIGPRRRHFSLQVQILRSQSSQERRLSHETMRLAGLESKIRKPKVTGLEKDVTHSMVRGVFFLWQTPPLLGPVRPHS